ncbi:MAG: PQQ-binding-like beta-propeller repeat protein [Planctomycetes bacterium]|nr:PQQ-binding-like beta-propeller repeat protein [Planctomycetota bacterium]
MNRLFLIVCTLASISTFSIGFAAKPGDWPQWRGINRDGRSAETGLLDSWPKEGPTAVWKNKNIGLGFSTVSIADGRVFTQGNVDGEGRIFCIDEKTGKTIWSVNSPAEKGEYIHKRRGNGARGTPAVDGNRVYTIGGGGAVTCLETKTGKVLWSLHLIDDLKGAGRRPGRVPGWGFSESPLIDGNHVIVTPGGSDGAVAALDKLTGDVVWRSTELIDGASYSSAIAADVLGVHQIIQFTSGHVSGLDASNGKLLWDYSESTNTRANVSSPIYSDGFVFSSSGYGTGGGLVKIVRNGNEFKAEEVYFSKDMTNHHGGIVLVDGYLYGFGRQLLCMDLKTGNIAWRSRKVVKGSLCYADGHFYYLSQANRVSLIEANPKEFVEKGRFEIPDSGRESWAHPVVANGRLYIRDQNTLTAYNIKK